MRLRWLLKAVKDTEALHEYIAQFNPYAAGKEVEKIVEAISRLRTHPYTGRQGRIKGTRELVVPNSSYIVAYRIKDESVEILRVIHAARKWPKKI